MAAGLGLTQRTAQRTSDQSWRELTVLRLRSFGELCVLGLSTVSLVDATCVTQSDFFFIHRDRFLNAFSNLPEVLAEMAAREDVYRRRPVRVPKASLGSI